MITVNELHEALSAHPGHSVSIHLPDGRKIPAHFHVTEVGHIRKQFIDCGGNFHAHEACLLQAWVASDVSHRISAGKLAGILEQFDRLSPNSDLPVEVEYEDAAISQYAVESVTPSNETIAIELASKHTDCLAKYVCGVEESENSSCCSGSGCC